VCASPYRTLDDEIVVGIAGDALHFAGRLDPDCAVPKRSHSDADGFGVAIEFLFEDAEDFLLDPGTDGNIVDLRYEF
jgi:hypothetical protein